MIAEGGYKFKKKYTDDAGERGDEVLKELRGYRSCVQVDMSIFCSIRDNS